ncbi:MAG: type II toxin-antitoxin system death-on-curing family toxin [Actinopolymorphaceae bacterium]
MIDWLTADDLIAINSAVLDGAPAVRDRGLVASAAMRPVTIAFGTEIYPTVEERPRLLHSVVCNHPFVDGNKRTGWTAVRVMLALHDKTPGLTEDEAFALVIDVATFCSQIEVKGIAERLQIIDRDSCDRTWGSGATGRRLRHLTRRRYVADVSSSCCRSSIRRIFPVSVFGSESTNSTFRG